jgi:hypothetical protein
MVKVSDTYLSNEKREEFTIKDGADCREKIRLYYSTWQENGFSEEWLKSFKERWRTSSYVWDFIKLMRDKRELSDDKYKAKEKRAIKKFKEMNSAVENLLLVMAAEEEAFKKAGIKEGRLEYECPICKGTAIVNRYMHAGSYHGLGSGCPTCNSWHT